MNKIMIVLGTRPEIIRLSVIIKKMELHNADYFIVHTGQNYDPRLSKIFFDELGLKTPKYVLTNAATCLSSQLNLMFTAIDKIIDDESPTKALILGDTNSALTSIIIERKDVPVFHMEAGNRCFDKEVPEEFNRKIIDSISYLNLPYVENSRQNLLNENKLNCEVIGNPIYEVMKYYDSNIQNSNVLSALGIEKNKYVLVTSHRSENVDNHERLTNIFEMMGRLPFPIIFSCHPRTYQKINLFSISIPTNVRMCQPFGFFDFVNLEQNARIVITDSGTVQEECCILKTPTITIRNSTERPETIECGSNVVTGLNVESMIAGFDTMMTISNWEIPKGYDVDNVSDKILKILEII